MADQIDESDGGVTPDQLNMEGKSSSSSTFGAQGEGVGIGSKDGSSVVVEQVPNVNVEEILQTIRAMMVADAAGGEKMSSGIVEGCGTKVPSPTNLMVGKDLGKLETEDGGQKESELSIGKLAVEVFPEEVWIIILGKVPDPNDLWNCTNTCQLFETILRPWRTGWMLEQALPHLYRHLPGKKLLECRLVSKGWNAAVDHFLEDHPSLRPYDGAGDPRRLEFVCPLKEKRIGERNCFSFTKEDMFILEDSDLMKMPVKNRNPFIGRYVTLRLEDGEDENDDANVIDNVWLDRLSEFLQLYGKEIWYLNVVFVHDPSGPFLLPKLVEFLTVKVFELLPNLRKFSMNCFGMDTFTFSPEFDLDIDPESIPCAPKLETISWPDYDQCITYNGDILYALMKRHHLQLRKLVLQAGPLNELRQLHWPNLAELHVDFYSIDEETRIYPCGVDMVELLTDVDMPNLCKLILELPADVSCEQLLLVINHLSSVTCLSTVRIIGSYELGWSIAEMKLGSANPAKIKNLELKPWDNDYRGHTPSSWDFLLTCFPFVENLNVFEEHFEGTRSHNYVPECRLMSMSPCPNYFQGTVEACRLETPDQIIDANEYIFDGQMYKSNIWEKLPRLKVFSFQWDVFTREEYEACANGGDREGAK